MCLDRNIVPLIYRYSFVDTLYNTGQVFLADKILTAVLMIVGIAVCSPIAAAAALAGSIIGSATALATGVPGAMIESGLFGFNSSLSVLAMYMFYAPSKGTAVLGILSGIMTVVAQQAMAPFLEPYGLPFMTLPFCIITLPFIILQGTTTLVIAVPLASMTVPEVHLKRVKMLGDGFHLLKEAIDPDNTKDAANILNRHLKESLTEIKVAMTEAGGKEGEAPPASWEHSGVRQPTEKQRKMLSCKELRYLSLKHSLTRRLEDFPWNNSKLVLSKLDSETQMELSFRVTSLISSMLPMKNRDHRPWIRKCL